MEISAEVTTDSNGVEYDYLSFRETRGGHVVVTTPYDPHSNATQHMYRITKLEWTKLLKACSLFFMKEEE